MSPSHVEQKSRLAAAQNLAAFARDVSLMRPVSDMAARSNSFPPFSIRAQGIALLLAKKHPCSLSISVPSRSPLRQVHQQQRSIFDFLSKQSQWRARHLLLLGSRALLYRNQPHVAIAAL